MQIREKRFAWRFNPAYAGNIKENITYDKDVQVQPRVCGEYDISSDKDLRRIGSTPRMRGIFSWIEKTCIKGRFNPAYAGNIDKNRYYFVEKQVQPRVCGEYEDSIQ